MKLERNSPWTLMPALLLTAVAIAACKTRREGSRLAGDGPVCGDPQASADRLGMAADEMIAMVEADPNLLGPVPEDGDGQTAFALADEPTTEEIAARVDRIAGAMTRLEAALRDGQSQTDAQNKQRLNQLVREINTQTQCIQDELKRGQSDRDLLAGKLDGLEALLKRFDARITALERGAGGQGGRSQGGQSSQTAKPRIACNRFSNDQTACTQRTQGECAFIQIDRFNRGCVHTLDDCVKFAHDADACNNSTSNRCTHAQIDRFNTGCVDKNAKCILFQHDGTACEQSSNGRCAFIQIDRFNRGCVDKAARCVIFNHDAAGCGTKTNKRCVWIQADRFNMGCAEKSAACSTFNHDSDACNSATGGRCTWAQTSTYAAECVPLR